MQHSDYISGYMQLGEVLKTLSIHAQSIAISKQQFFDQPVNQLTSSGVRYTRAPLAARGTATCSMVQTCQVNWTITIPANILAIQLNRCEVAAADANQLNARVKFNAKPDPIAENTTNMQQGNQKYYGKAAEGPLNSEHLKFWLGFSTACGPFNQFAILRDAQNQWNTAIYAREQAVICSNSLTDLCTNNSVSVSSLEFIVAGKRHCGVFIDIPLCQIDRAAAAGTPYFYLIPYDITFSGVLDLNQLNPIFNSFPVLTRNYAFLYLQLWVQDFLQDLKIVWLNKSDVMQNNHLAYAMIPPEKPDIVYLLSREEDEDPLAYSFGFQAVSGSMQSIMSFANIKALFMTFAMPQYPTCKATKTLYPNKYMLAWKMATDDSFIRGYNSSKIGARTNIQVILNGNLTKGIVDTTQLNPSQNQNDFKHFIGMRSYPDPNQVALTPIMHYLCDVFIRITFDDNPDPQVLSMDVIGEIGGSSIRSG
ncbi:MAG: hypothetical protein EZS28_029055 [Streblomastix strix]|uniref:Uncharacterized protein n=1 Tax=Streblomastix strix TaxID=222440 RepID=A0A5J4UYC1_9EUKA|nr:MAG: hypothetical protein EZS28_029055 [Streblomastix strix]